MLFEKKEYKERLKKVKDSMQKQGIDLLVSHDPANMNYLTGYDAWSFYYAQCVLVHINEDEPKHIEHNRKTKHHILLDNSCLLDREIQEVQCLFFAC